MKKLVALSMVLTGGLAWGCNHPGPDRTSPVAALLLASGSSGAPIDRIAAASVTASTNASCIAIQPFYWEIGDGHGSLGSGSPGGTYTASTKVSVASASKWIWGAYVLQRFAGTADDATTNATTRSYLQMTSGYTNFDDDSCGGTTTVNDCALTTGTDGIHSNTYHVSAHDGKFRYDGGHFQQLASTTAGLGDYEGTLLKHGLADEIMSRVGTDTDLAYSSPQLAGGVRTNALGYAVFLRRMINGNIVMGSHLGENAICTLPALCATASYSPFPENVHYSYGHWVEDSPGNDGSFSSPGKFGFYPWIDASRSYYGIISRHDESAGAYYDSIQCGREIRRAFVTGVAIP